MDTATDRTPESTAPDAQDKLGFFAKLVYGAGEMGPGLAENAISFYLLFYYTDVVRMDPRLAGLALMIGRFWDAFTDPLMGHISDHTRTRLGRRRPYLIFGGPLYGVFFFLLWAPLLGVQGNAAFPLLLFGYLFYSTAATICQVPFYTLGGELSTDYHERSSIIGFRQTYATVGILIGGALTPVAVGLFTDVDYAEIGSRPAWLMMAALFGGIGACTWVVSGLGSRERVHESAIDENYTSLLAVPLGAFRAAVSTLKNPMFRILAVQFLVVQVAFTMTTATLPYLLKWWLDKADMMTPILGVLIVGMLPFLGIWVLLSRRTQKRPAYIAGLLIMGLLALQSLWMFTPTQWTGWLYIYPFVFAIGLAAHFVFPWSLMPDIIDYGEFETGKRSDGSYFGVMTFLRKSSAALSGQIVGILLWLIGYDAALDAQTPGTLLGIRIIYGVIPSIAFLIGAWFVVRLPLTQARSHEIREALRARRKTQEAASIA